MEMEKVIADLMQTINGRYYGKYPGIVIDNADPKKLGRLKLRIPQVMGEAVSGWAFPCLPYGGEMNRGTLFIPEAGAHVWVEFAGGNLESPVWVGTYWGEPGGESELPKPNNPDGSEQGSVQDPPTRKIIKTEKGHTIQFEDADGEEMVTLVEAVNGHVITMDQEGIKITDGANENKIVLDTNGIIIEDKNGNLITMDSASVTVKSNRIKIGENAAEPLVLGNQLKTALDNWINSTFATHTHTGNLGAPTTPPVPGAPLVLDPALSKTNKVE